MSKSTKRAFDDLDLLARYTGRKDPESHSDGESLDVLLQLTLPIVLILALFIVTQMEALENAFKRKQIQLEEAKEELKEKDEQLEWERSSAKASAEGKIKKDAIITFQEKYLREATEEVIKKERERLGIDAYRGAAPSSHMLSQGEIGRGFKDSSQRIYEVFESTDSLEKQLAEIDKQIIAEFHKKLDKHLKTHTHYRPWHRADMEDITPENRGKYQRDLRARRNEIINEAVGVQIKMISDAYNIEDWRTVEGSDEIWGTAYEKGEEVYVKHFRNLTLGGIIRKIEATGVFIFPQTRDIAKALEEQK